MAVSLVNGTQNNSVANGSQITVTKPTDVLAGDVLLAFFTSNSQDCTPPSGFVEIVDQVSEVIRHQIFYKIAGSSEPADYTFTVPSAASPLLITMNAWRGVDSADVLDIDPQVETSLTHSEPYTTPTLPGAGATSGRIIQVRVCRISSSTPVDLTESDPNYSRRSSLGQFSGGSVSYSQGIFSQEHPGYDGTADKPGLAITSSGSESHNIVAAFALKSAGIPGTMEATLGLPTSSMSGSVAVPAVLDVDLPLPVVEGEIFNGEYDGTLDVVVPITVSMTGASAAAGDLSVAILPTVEMGGETRRFAENVVNVGREDRWLILTQDGYRLGSRADVREFRFFIDLPLLEVSITAGAAALGQTVSAVAVVVAPTAVVVKELVDGLAAGSVTANAATVTVGQVPAPASAPVGVTAYKPQVKATFNAGQVNATATANKAGLGNTFALAEHVSVTCHN